MAAHAATEGSWPEAWESVVVDVVAGEGSAASLSSSSNCLSRGKLPGQQKPGRAWSWTGGRGLLRQVRECCISVVDFNFIKVKCFTEGGSSSCMYLAISLGERGRGRCGRWGCAYQSSVVVQYLRVCVIVCVIQCPSRGVFLHFTTSPLCHALATKLRRDP